MKGPASNNLRQGVAFDMKVSSPDGYGGASHEWSEMYVCRAEYRYQAGGESVQASGVVGTASIKVRIRSTEIARQLTSAHRMRDAMTGAVFNIREVDAVTDWQNVWLVVESGVAV